MTSNFPPIAVTSTVKSAGNLGFDPAKPASVPVASAVEVKSTESDKYDIPKNPEQSKEKKGAIQGAKDIIRTVKKFCISFAEYTKGTLKGLFEGALAGLGVLGIGSFVNFVKKHGKNVVLKTDNEVKNYNTLGYLMAKPDNGVKKHYKKSTVKVADTSKLVNIFSNKENYNKPEYKEIWNAIKKVVVDKKSGTLEFDTGVIENKLKNVNIPEFLCYDKEVFKKIKFVPAKTLAVVTGVAVLLGSLWKASLNANGKKADVDHKYTTTPIVSK